ncbi:hypothetical protein GLAREA_05143 [Glarea lozoyensis ATCC 20868]|uniref:Heterokaryon incompatibility domain-containing protein n=1 Tax=Glarea lozoyensis (strain ATCC 20868 / MF5171) TaxID=1116229 RepID=S3DDL8_GLAL2|nr:uncharacterized protein GLAREA_05143 [Glarea lozoyensis ATCC 20868]EPE35805.1 hypothetical protein GLAREA_05143 [Glarea lozoyensis ATCC 20868]
MELPRVRSPPVQEIPAETVSWPVDWYEHSKLDDSIDCIRLIRLSCARVNGEVSCTLEQVPFADRPKYEALSYCWGELPVVHTILINGKKFKVGQNLFHALNHFVDGKHDRILWIDAICIDQTSIEERNWQLRLMPFIYRRAQKVLIWVDWVDGKRQFPESGQIARRFSNGFYLNSPYWKRLWIVQEVGQARDLEIHFREGSQSWTNFVEKLQRNNHHDASLPQRLQEEREDRYGSYTMLNLMRNHKDKFCKDPRDKIYALIGLARDVMDSRYPVNYSTSLEQVYFDAIEYRNSDPSRSQHDIVEFSQLARQLLGVFLDGKRENTNIIESHLSTKRNETVGLSNSVQVSAKLLGRVVCLGPTVEEFLSSAKATENWNSRLLERCGKVDQEIVSKENDFFLARIEDFFSNSQNIVESFGGWEPERFDVRQDSVLTSMRPRPPTDDISTDVRLCLLYRFRDREESSFLALVPRGTQPNSVLCQISGIQRAIVLSLQDPMIRLIGSAAVSIPAGLIETCKMEEEDFEGIFHKPEFTKLDRQDMIKLNLDLEFMHHLSRPLSMGSSTEKS